MAAVCVKRLNSALPGDEVQLNVERRQSADVARASNQTTDEEYTHPLVDAESVWTEVK